MASSLALPVFPRNENAVLCALCGGHCCRSMPGTYHPGDLGRTEEEVFEALVELLARYEAAIDWLDGDPRPPGERRGLPLARCCYVRPRIDGVLSMEHSSPGGVCQHFSAERGCALPFEKRPYQCRALTPTLDRRGGRLPLVCVEREDSDEVALAIAWAPYQDIIRRSAREAQRRRAATKVTLGVRRPGVPLQTISPFHHRAAPRSAPDRAESLPVPGVAGR